MNGVEDILRLVQGHNETMDLGASGVGYFCLGPARPAGCLGSSNHKECTKTDVPSRIWYSRDDLQW